MSTVRNTDTHNGNDHDNVLAASCGNDDRNGANNAIDGLVSCCATNGGQGEKYYK